MVRAMHRLQLVQLLKVCAVDSNTAPLALLALKRVNSMPSIELAWCSAQMVASGQITSGTPPCTNTPKHPNGLRVGKMARLSGLIGILSQHGCLYSDEAVARTARVPVWLQTRGDAHARRLGRLPYANRLCCLSCDIRRSQTPYGMLSTIFSNMLDVVALNDPLPNI